MNDCIFCRLLKEKHRNIFYRDPTRLFVALWNARPATPGHAMVLPTRHIQFFRDMSREEMQAITMAVAATIRRFMEQPETI